MMFLILVIRQKITFDQECFQGFVDSKEVQANVVKYFASFDEAIQDFNVEELQQEDEKDTAKVIRLMRYTKWWTVRSWHLFL